MARGVWERQRGRQRRRSRTSTNVNKRQHQCLCDNSSEAHSDASTAKRCLCLVRCARLAHAGAVRHCCPRVQIGSLWTHC